MASPTRKIKKIRKAKVTAQGARRKRAIRHDRRVKLAELAKKLGLDVPGALATPENATEG
jgi:hypothetical protein